MLLGFADLEKTLSAAIAVFVFNITYELLLSRNLKQYAICPVIDLINHSSKVTVRARAKQVGELVHSDMSSPTCSCHVFDCPSTWHEGG